MFKYIVLVGNERQHPDLQFNSSKKYETKVEALEQSEGFNNVSVYEFELADDSGDVMSYSEIW